MSKDKSKDMSDKDDMSGFIQSLRMDALTLNHLTKLYSNDNNHNGHHPLYEEAYRMIKAISQCKGRIHITGIGKSGIVARRFASSLASTGTPAHFTHASEWIHGDLGNAIQGIGIIFGVFIILIYHEYF